MARPRHSLYRRGTTWRGFKNQRAMVLLEHEHRRSRGMVHSDCVKRRSYGDACVTAAVDRDTRRRCFFIDQ